MVVENEEVLGADQGNTNLPPTLEAGGSLTIVAANEFGTNPHIILLDHMC